MWGRKKRSTPSLFRFLLLFLLVLVFGFVFRKSILGYLAQNPDTAQHVPNFVLEALERDLSDWHEEDLQARYQQLAAEVQLRQVQLKTAADQGQAKFLEVKQNLEATQKALEETKAALDNLAAAGDSLKDSVTLD